MGSRARPGMGGETRGWRPPPADAHQICMLARLAMKPERWAPKTFATAAARPITAREPLSKQRKGGSSTKSPPTITTFQRSLIAALNLSISVQFGRASPKARKYPGIIHRLPRTTEFGDAEPSCVPSVLRRLAPENPISKRGIREHYRSDAGGADHHQSLAGGG
jgi:hypothetical protein